jgi:hypothetical protein
MKHLLTCAALLLCFAHANSQISAGRDFWFGFMQNYYQQTGEMRIYINSDTYAQGTLSAPGQAWSQTFAVTPGIATEIIVPDSISEIAVSDTIIHKALHITTDSLITVFTHYYQPYTADAAIILPTKALGNDYLVTSWFNSSMNNGMSEFLITATQNNTLIEITPSALAGIHAAGVPYTISLDSGEIYQLQAVNGDLTGTILHGTLDKPFALFSGNTCANVIGCGYCDYLFEQVLPNSFWGTDYISIPYLTRDYDVFRVLAAQNGTTFQINNGAAQNLNAGQFYEFTLDSVSSITSNLPISVMQYSTGSDCDSNMDEYGDPFMINLSPNNQPVIIFNFNAFENVNSNFTYYANIIARTGDLNSLRLDGDTIAASFITLPQNPAYSYAQLTITQGNHSVVADSGVLAYVYGYGPYESYGYSAGVRVEVPTKIIVDSFHLGQSYYFRGAQLTEPGSSYYVAQYPATNNDSLLILKLSKLPMLNNFYTANVCNGESYNFNGQSLNMPGLYIDTLQSSGGEDSVIVSLTLTVNSPVYTTMADSFCANTTYQFNQRELSLPGIYTDTLQTVTTGCDSVVILSLDVIPFTGPTITRIGDTLFAQAFDTYQWLRDNVIIPGANQQTLTITQNGTYTLVAGNLSGCVDTSQGLQVISTGIENVAAANLARLYPNPNTGTFTLEINSDELSTVTITNCLGQTVLTETKAGRKKQFTMPDTGRGVYFVSFKQSGLTQTLKFTLL